ncbi:MAG TPA: 4'-phosphopantetheinyl transferase superfamily protein [Steroidobacteraceae bacterium]|nr:4'-phosphopantetheinyl transferase superfamily protein [Steroidobacteraceae bacterium]
MQQLELWLATPEAGNFFDPATLSAADLQRWQTIRSPQRRADWMSSRALLAHRPPAAAGAWSLSHSAGHAALALGPAGFSLGVDLERCRPRRFLDLAANWFSPREFEQLSELPLEEQEARFYLLWTLKEACTKALGLALLQALRDCEWWLEGAGWQARLPIRSAWRAWAYAPRPDLRLALLAIGKDRDRHLTDTPALHGWPTGSEPARGDPPAWPCLLELARPAR